MIMSSSITMVYALGFSGSVKIAILDALNENVPNASDVDILVIDGIWLEGKTTSGVEDLESGIKEITSDGVPTIIIGGSINFGEIVDDILVHTVNQPSIVSAIKVYPENRKKQIDLMPMSHNLRLLQSSDKGFLPSDQLFISSNLSLQRALTKAMTWAYDRVWNTRLPTPIATENTALPSVSPSPSSIDVFPTSGGSDPEWLFFGTVTYSEEWVDYGKLDITQKWYVLDDDDSNTYDWWNVVLETTSTPGIVAYTGSDWRTADIWNWMDAGYFGDLNLLVDYGPLTTSGVSTVNYDIGVQAGQDGARVTCEMPVSYSAQSVHIYNQSEPSRQLAKWWHDVPEQEDNGMTIYTIKPGATVRVLPIGPTTVCSSYKVRYMKPRLGFGWVWPEEFTSDEIRFGTILPYSRSINIFVVEASDSPLWWVGDALNVEAGVIDAIIDAMTNTRVKLPNETFNAWAVLSNEVLLSLVENPPLRAVFVNAHGEIVPIPSQYFGPYVEITSPSDGATIYSNPTVNAIVVPPSGLGLGGQWPSYPRCRWYRPSTGDYGAWLQMYSSGGDNYYRTLSLPAHDTYIIYVGAMSAENMLTIAHITVNHQYSGGGCPYISTWDGTHYIVDNNLLPSGYSDTDVMDYYKLQQPLVPNGDIASLQLSELEWEHDFIDQVKLLTVDHKRNVKVAVSPEGQMLTYRRPILPLTAIDDEGNNVRYLIKRIDKKYYQGHNGSHILLDFGNLNISSGAKLVLRTDRPPLKVSIHIQVTDEEGNWNNVATIMTREYWATDIIDMSEHLPDANGRLRVRLYFTAEHKLDFVGLDKSPQAAIEVNNAEFISATHSAGIRTAYQNMLCSDNIYAELTPGYSIQMNFVLPIKENITDVRDYIFLVEGRYKKASSPIACLANWQDWFAELENNARQYGWIWASVAGYSSYYFGNSWYWSMFSGYNPTADGRQPHEEGLKQFLQKDVTCNYLDGNEAERKYDFNNEGFLLTYTGLDANQYVGASRPLPWNAPLPYDALGYVDTSTGDHVTEAITMNTSIQGEFTLTGHFIHSGLSIDADQDGTGNTTQDDWLKGYIATALAIEESRALVTLPRVFRRHPTDHTMAPLVTMRPGSWKFDYDEYGHYTRVWLMFTIGAYYTWYQPYGSDITYFLSHTDFDLSSANTDIRFTINTESTGLDFGTGNELMDDLNWWAAGVLVGLTPGVGVFLGGAVGLIPIIKEYWNPTEGDQTDLNHHVWVNGTWADPDWNNRGTMSFLVEARFYGLEGQGARLYEFDTKMTSWVGWEEAGFFNHNWRYRAIPHFTQVTYNVTW